MLTSQTCSDTTDKFGNIIDKLRNIKDTFDNITDRKHKHWTDRLDNECILCKASVNFLHQHFICILILCSHNSSLQDEIHGNFGKIVIEETLESMLSFFLFPVFNNLHHGLKFT